VSESPVIPEIVVNASGLILGNTSLEGCQPIIEQVDGDLVVNRIAIALRVVVADIFSQLKDLEIIGTEKSAQCLVLVTG